MVDLLGPRLVPGVLEEVHHGEEEGIIFDFLVAPVRFMGDDRGWVKEMECIRMELGEPDDSGRRRPVPIKGSEFIMKTDMVVNAVGTNANRLLFQSTPDIGLNKWGYVDADPETGETSKPGVYAGGDIVTGSATVILAMGAGKNAARAIHDYVMNKKK